MAKQENTKGRLLLLLLPLLLLILLIFNFLLTLKVHTIISVYITLDGAD